MKKHLVLLLPLLLLASCDSSVFYSEYIQVNEPGWLPSDSACFDVPIDDTNAVYNFLIEVRNNIDYPYSNAFFFNGPACPDGTIARDTLEMPLAAPSGQWYGKRAGRYVDTRCYFRRNARFPMTGTYHFAITNGMRDSAITGIRDIGLRIEHSKTYQHGQ